MLTRIINRSSLFKRFKYSFAEDGDDGGEFVGAPKLTEDTATQLRRRFEGEIKSTNKSMQSRTSSILKHQLYTTDIQKQGNGHWFVMTGCMWHMSS